MKNSIILLIKECIAAHACIQTENGNVIGLFLDNIAVDHIADDVAEAMEAVKRQQRSGNSIFRKA